MPTENNFIVVACIEVEQPIGKFYIAAIDSKDLAEISFADRIRIEEGKRELETVSGLERPLSAKRVLEIQKYVSNVDASFPTGIILAINAEDAQYDPSAKTLSIRRAHE